MSRAVDAQYGLRFSASPWRRDAVATTNRERRGPILPERSDGADDRRHGEWTRGLDDRWDKPGPHHSAAAKRLSMTCSAPAGQLFESAAVGMFNARHAVKSSLS
jgi:hypothetical protein